MRPSERRGLTVYVEEFPRPSENFIHREVAVLARLRRPLLVATMKRLPFAAVDPVLRRSRPTVDVLAPKSPGAMIRHGAAAIRHPWRWLRTAAAALRIVRGPVSVRLWRMHQGVLLGLRIEECGHEHLHAHFLHKPAEVAWIAARWAGVPFTVSAHAADLARQHVHPQVLADCARVICCHAAGLAALRRLYPGARGVLLHHGVPTPAAPREATRDGGPPLLLALGRMVPKKGFAELLRALGLLARRGVAFRARLQGDGPLRTTLEGIIRSEGLEHCVTFGPFLPFAEVQAAMRAADLVVIPSHPWRSGSDSDGIPNVLLEAMACGTPVVATPFDGALEVIRSGDNGWLATGFGPAEIADALAIALASGKRANDIAANARRTVCEKFHARKQGELLASLLRDR